MINLLAGAPLLTLFLAIALGTLLGAIPFGPVRFGAAGALFVGLAIGALDPRLGEGFAVVQSIGLALFVYTIGLSAGRTFFKDLRRQTPLILGAAALLAVHAVLVVVVTTSVGISGELAAGLFSGSLTATPALAAATAATGSADPAVGYAISYPLGVMVGMLGVTLVTRKRLPASKDPDPVSSAGLRSVTVEVEGSHRVSDIPSSAAVVGRAGGEVRVSYLLRDREVTVAHPEEMLRDGDRVVLVGVPAAVTRAAEHLGHEVDVHLAHDRSVVDFRRFVLSNPSMAGRTVEDLRIPEQFGGIITRVRRGDADLLATADMRLQLGDRIRVVVPRDRMDDISALFGDSERKVTEVDFWSMGVGIALGVLVGLVTVPLGGGAALALGSAAGPLVVGLVLGRLERTGPVVWTIPNAANLTIRQLGLVVFLAAVGLASGQAFASLAFSWDGLRIGLVAIVLLVMVLGLFWLLGRLVGLSTPRVAGAMAGFIGQPAILSHANSLVNDERTEAGYSAMFTLGIITKIVLVQVILVF